MCFKSITIYCILLLHPHFLIMNATAQFYNYWADDDDGYGNDISFVFLLPIFLNAF